MQMLISISGPRIKAICLFCGEKVEREQIIRGKAICKDCDCEVFDTKIQITTSPDELYKNKLKEEEEIFLKTMKRIFLRKRL